MIEYTVVRAPEEGTKSILARSKSGYAEALEIVLNRMGMEDWEFVRSEPGPDKHPVLIFQRRVKKLEDDLPGITLADHRPPRPAVQPRPARSLRDEEREAVERLKVARRPVVRKPKADTPPAQEAKAKTNVADILSEKIARAKSAEAKTQG